MSDAEARFACTDLVHAYNNLIDTGHADRVPDLFAADAVLDLGFELTGIDAIQAAMEARAANTQRRTTHLTSNLQFREVSDRTAAATSVLVLFVLGDDPPTPSAIIRCNDEFVRPGGDEWRFSRRSLSVISGKI
jgi:hypothetical protein